MLFVTKPVSQEDTGSGSIKIMYCFLFVVKHKEMFVLKLITMFRKTVSYFLGRFSSRQLACEFEKTINFHLFSHLATPNFAELTFLQRVRSHLE